MGWLWRRAISGRIGAGDMFRGVLGAASFEVQSWAKMRWISSLAAVLLLSGCVGGEPTPQWSQLLRVEDRFSVYLHEAGAVEAGASRVLRLVYIYGDGQIEWEGEEVAWQEYPEMEIDCERNHVVLGPRARYAPDGRLVFSDRKDESKLIAPGTLTEIAASARCDGLYPADTHSIVDGPDWMREARRRLSAWIETRSL